MAALASDPTHRPDHVRDAAGGGSRESVAVQQAPTSSALPTQVRGRQAAGAPRWALRSSVRRHPGDAVLPTGTPAGLA